jgi:hypothetical protein
MSEFGGLIKKGRHLGQEEGYSKGPKNNNRSRVGHNGCINIMG